MGAIDNIIQGATNSIGSGVIGLGLGTLKGAIGANMSYRQAKKLAKMQNEMARQNTLDKWSLEKSAMQKAGINMSALNGMQTTAIQQATPTQNVDTNMPLPSIAEGAQQMSQANVNKTEKDKNEEFMKQAGDYWASETKQRLADAQLKGAQEAFTNVQKLTGDYEYRVRQGVINAYGGPSEYGRALNLAFWRRYESLGQEITESMSRVGLNQWNTQLAMQKTIESQEFVRIGWYNAVANKMYQQGMLKLGHDRLEFDKNAFKSNLWFEMDKFNRSIGLEFRKFNWQKGIDAVQMQYTKTLIKGEEQTQYWKPVTVLSQAFRDVCVGIGGLSGAAGGLAGALGMLSKVATLIK